MELEAAFQEQVDLIASYVNLDRTEIEACLRNPVPSRRCKSIWNILTDRWVRWPNEVQWTLALELDPTTLENLCKISLIMRRFCEDDAFWAAKFRKDVGREEKFYHYKEESWKQNYVLAFEKYHDEPLEDLTFLELVLMAENHGIEQEDGEPWNVEQDSEEVLRRLIAQFAYHELDRFRESMVRIARYWYEDYFREDDIFLEKDTSYVDLNASLVMELLPEITSLSSLQTLRLYNNQLIALPPEIGNLSSLQILDLSSNALTSLPPEIGSLSSLVAFYLDSNWLTSLPSEIGNLSSLRRLNVNHNQLITLPPEIGSLSSLRNLYLNHNQLTTLPREIGNLSLLEILFLQSNRLTSLPSEIGNLASLRIFNVKNNQLTALPSEMVHLHVLEFLDGRNNRLTRVPEILTPENFSQILKIRLEGNPIEPMPEEFL